MPITYGLRMRNTEPAERGDWATVVKSRRAATGMSGAELSRRLKVDRATIWRWETGKQKPDTLEIVAAFAEIFAMDLDDALAAAGLRPAEVAHRPEPVLDPDVAALLAKLEDPQTSPAVKEQIRTMMRALVELAESQPVRPPVRRRKVS